MLIYTRPSGSEIEVQDTKGNQAEAKRLGWKLKGAERTAVPSPAIADVRGLPWDERINTKNKAFDDAGNWKYKTGNSKEFIAEVEAELIAKLTAGA